MLAHAAAIALALVACIAALLAYGALRWRAGTATLHKRLERARVAHATTRFDVRELDGVPPPVRRYLRTVLSERQPIVAAASIEQIGTFDTGTGAARWKPFASNQRVVTQRLGFDWDARIAMAPGLATRVHDAYVAGEGFLHASLLGLVTVAHMRGSGDIARGELMRFLAEAAWYPTALLPSQGIRWQAVDDRSARAALRDGDVDVSLVFAFADDGLIDTVRAESRGRTVGRDVVPTPWQGRFWNYAVRDGMRIPLNGEVAWVLADGARPYWRGQLVTIGYEFER